MAIQVRSESVRGNGFRVLPLVAGALLALGVATIGCSKEEEKKAATTPAPTAAPTAPRAPSEGQPPATPPPATTDPDSGAMSTEPGAKAGEKEIRLGGQDPEVLAEALNNLRSSDAEVRADAVLDIEPEGVGLRTLVDTLADADPEVRIAVISQLEDGDSPEATAGIVRALGDKDPEVVLQAIDALEFVGDETSVSDLKRLLEHPSEEVRAEAQDAIDYLSED
jgi:HEAT repeat protein